MAVEFDQREAVWAREGEAVDGTGARYNSIQAAVDAGTGLVLVGPGTYEENVTVPNNSDQDDGVMMGVGQQTIIDGGTDGHALEIKADDFTVSDLAVRTTAGQGNGYDGIKLEQSGGNISDPRIRDITVLDSDRHAIHGFGISNGVVSGCVIENADEKGIYGRTWAGCVVSNNTVGDGGGGPGGQGIHYTDNNNIIQGNYIENVGLDGIWSQGDSDTIDANRVKDAGDDGIDVNGSGTTVSDNNVTGSSGSDIDLDDATNPVVTGNVPTSANNQGGGGANVVDSPNGHIQNVVLQDGESAEISVFVPNGETLTVQRWGGYQISDGTAPTGLDLELKDGSDTVQATENTTNTENTDGVVSHANSSGSGSIFKLAIANDTGSAINDPGVGAFFGYDVS